MTRSIGRWKLPQPTDIKEDNEWISIPRIARTIPFGYVQDENDPDVLRPVPDELNLLEKARAYVNQYSYRQVANWISTQTGRYISHVGLMKRVKLEQKRKREASNQRYLAQRYKEALEKAEKIEATRFGARDQGTRTTEA